MPSNLDPSKFPEQGQFPGFTPIFDSKIGEIYVLLRFFNMFFTCFFCVYFNLYLPIQREGPKVDTSVVCWGNDSGITAYWKRNARHQEKRNIYWNWKNTLRLLRSCGPLVLSFFYSFGVVLWSLGTLVLLIWGFMMLYVLFNARMLQCKYCRNANLLVSCWFQVLQIPCEWIPCKWDSYCHSPTLQIPCKMRCKLIRGFNLNNTNTTTITTSRKGTSSSNSKLCPNTSLYSDQPQNVTSPATKFDFFLRILKPPQFHVYCTVHERGLINPNNCKTEI